MKTKQAARPTKVDTVQVRAFHVPSARFESGSANGEISPPNEMVEPIWEGPIAPCVDDHQICEAAFRKLNLPDRPNGHFASALSVGDIVTLRVDTDQPSSFQVAPTGFIALKHPVLGFDDAVQLMLTELDGEELPY